MKKYLLSLICVMLATAVWAGGKRLYVWLYKGASSADKQTVKQKALNVLSLDPDVHGVILTKAWRGLPEAYHPAKPAWTGRVWSIDIDRVRGMLPALGITLADMESWRGAGHLDNSNHLQFVVGQEGAITNEGFVWVVNQ